MRTDLRAQIAAMLDEYRATRARIERLQATAAHLRVWVSSPDRSVTVTVDVSGELQELTIDPVRASRLDAPTLADNILSASRLAAAQARERLRTAARDALPERLHDLVGPDGSVDLAALLPADLASLIGDRS
jgi:DNA-binding protein YbaB